MVTSSKARPRVRYGVSSPITWVWGSKEKGASVFKVTEKSVSGKPVSDWRMHLWKNGKAVYVQRDFPTKAEAVRDAKSAQRHYKVYAR